MYAKAAQPTGLEEHYCLAARLSTELLVQRSPKAAGVTKGCFLKT